MSMNSLSIKIKKNNCFIYDKNGNSSILIFINIHYFASWTKIFIHIYISEI